MRIYSTASAEPVLCDVTALQNGAAVDPSADAVAFAFLADLDATPGDADWHSGTWDVDSSGPTTAYAAQCVVGPGGVELAAGTFGVWVKITHSPYLIVRNPGIIVVR